MHQPHDLIFGLESEYAIMSSDRSVDRKQWACGLLSYIAEHTHCIADGGAQGLYTPFGRIYMDVGGHPEFATAPVTNPWDLLQCQRLFERLVMDYAGQTGNTTFLVRANVDYLSGTKWGSHDNIQIQWVYPEAIGSLLVPYLATRSIFTGAGGFHVHTHHRPSFVLSPRAGMSRGEPLYGFKYVQGTQARRLHITCGENVLSDISLIFKVVLPALLVRLVENVSHALTMPQLKDPGAVKRQVSDRWWRDMRCPVRLSDGSHRDALEVQTGYCQLLKQYVDAPFMPPWTDFVLGLWQELIDDFASYPLLLHSQLDWVIKQEYFNTYLEQWYGLRLDSLKNNTLPENLFYNLYKLDYDFGRLTDNAYASQLRQDNRMTRLPYLPELSMDTYPMHGIAQERTVAIQEYADKSGTFACIDWGRIIDRHADRVVHRFGQGGSGSPYMMTMDIIKNLDHYLR